MCSKCYKEKQDSNSIKIPINSQKKDETTQPEISIVEAEGISLTIHKTLEEQSKNSGNVLKINKLIQKPKSPVKQTIRCKECKKRVGIYGFDCRCGSTFCDTHRYSDKHNCTYDYLNASKKHLAEANPQLSTPKLKDKI